MNPEFCPPHDYGLYYAGTFMTHRKLGVVFVNLADENQLQAKLKGCSYAKVEPEDLECLWPSPKSINMGDGALYIGRTSRREARKSATINHYYIKYDYSKIRRTVSSGMMYIICSPYYSYPDLKKALSFLSVDKRAVAISPDIIIEKPLDKITNKYGIICCGEFAGFLKVNNNSVSFHQDMNSPPAKRAEFKLRREGILSC